MPYANNKGADQPAHPRSLIGAFVVRCLDSIIPLVFITAISNLYLASAAVQAGLSLPWSQTPKTGFLVMWLNYGRLKPVCCKFDLSIWAASWQNNKVTVCPAKTQISLGIRIFAVRSMGSFLYADSEDPDQSDLSLRWAHMPFCWFCHEAAHMFFFK